MKNKLVLIAFNCIVFQVYSQNCTRVVDTEAFGSSQAFISVGAGLVTITNGAGQWQNAACGVYDRMYRPLNDTLSDNYFRIAFDFTVLPNAINNGAGADLIALTAGTEDFLSYDNSANYALTNQDGLGVVITSAGTMDNDINNWHLQLEEKDADQRYTGINTIPLSTSFTNYYLVFERSSPGMVNMMLYTDSTQAVLLGQAQNTIHPTVENLYVFQFGVTTFGWITRHFNGSIDNVIVCDDTPTGIEETGVVSMFTLSENLIYNEEFNISSAYWKNIRLMVHDVSGKLIHRQQILPGENKISSEWNPGIYFLQFSDDNKLLETKHLIIN